MRINYPVMATFCFSAVLAVAAVNANDETKMPATTADREAGQIDVKGTGETVPATATGRRTHEPIVIRKRIDKSSPMAKPGEITQKPAKGKEAYFVKVDSETTTQNNQQPADKTEKAPAPPAGPAAGKRQHRPVTVTKSMDNSATPAKDAPAEKGSQQATGRRTYEPIVIRKRIDKSTPVLANTGDANLEGDVDAGDVGEGDVTLKRGVVNSASEPGED